jgi:glycosyltransferase involved in cell wall biosynthesis
MKEVDLPEIGNVGSVNTHLVVTPARNEAENLQRLGQCLIEQTWLPNVWIVVDNGSTDDTREVMQALARVHAWIRLLSIEGEARPVRGRGTVRAFEAGVTSESSQADLVTNLDADVSFEPTYFDSLRREFERNPRLGVASGVCYELDGDGWKPVNVTHPFLRGAARTYRRECFAQLLPLEARHGSEAIDVIRANVRGWETATIPTLSYCHHRPTGARDVSRFSGWVEEGKVSHYMWYRPSYMLLRTAYRVIGRRDPAAVGLAWGYANSALCRRPRHQEAGFREFVHENQSVRNWRLRAREAGGRR